MSNLRRILSIAAGLALAVAATPAFAVAPLNYYNDLAFTSPSQGLIGGLADGQVGVFYRTADGGSTFASATVGDREVVGLDTYGLTSWATMTNDDRPVYSLDGGVTWNRTAMMPYSGGDLMCWPADIEVLAGGRVVVVGQSRQAVDGGGYPRGDLAFIDTTTNGGLSWTKSYEDPLQTGFDNADQPHASYATFTDIDEAPSGAYALAVGNAYADANSGTLNRSFVMRSDDGGASWSASRTISTTYAVPCATAASDQVAFAFTKYKYFLKSVDGGSTWAQLTISTPVAPVVTAYFKAFACDSLDAQTAVVVGTEGSAGFGTILYTKNGGTSWTRVLLDNTATPPLRDVQMVDASTWIAVGDNNTMYVTNNAGVTWSKPAAVDTTPPTIAITGVAQGASYTATVTPVVTISGQSTQTVTLDAAPFVSGTPVSTDGTHTLSVSATDAAGNAASQSVTFGVQVDRTPPVIVIGGVADGQTYTTTVTPTIDITGQTTSTVTLDSAPFISGTPVSTNATHTLAVAARDANGNWASERVVFRVDIDRVAPVISITGVADGASYTATVTPVVTISGQSTQSVTLDSEPFVSGTPVSIDGTHTLSVAATDAAGNSAARSVTFGVQVDRTPPVIIVGGVEDGATYSTDVTPTISITGQTTSTVTLDGVRFTSGTRVSTDGTHTLEVWASDANNNQSARTVVFGLSVLRSVATITSTSTVLSAYGKSATITGTIECSGTPLPTKRLELWTSKAGASFVKSSTTATSSSIGTFSFTVTPTEATSYQVRFAGDAWQPPSLLSNAVKITPRAYVSNPIAPSTMYRTRYYTVTGTMKPRHLSGSSPVRIFKYRYVSGTWKSYGYSTAKASNYWTYTKYTGSVKLPYAGRWRLRAYHPTDTYHAASWSSGYDYVTVR